MWRFDVTIKAKRHRQGKFHSRGDAELAIAGLRLKAQRKTFGLPSPVKPVSVKEFIDQATTRSTGSVQRKLLALFASVVDTNKPVVDLRRSDMAAFLDALRAKNLAIGTLRVYKQTLLAMLNRAGEWFEALSEWTPPKFPRLPKGQRRQRVLSVDELAKLFSVWRRTERFQGESAQARDDRLELYDIARLMLLTGARREEIEKITPMAINQRERWLNLHSGKTSRWHAVALSNEALNLLQGRLLRKPMFRKFRSSTVHHVSQRVGREAGLLAGQKEDGGWTFHDLRRTAATWIESNGIAYSAVMATLGHSRGDVTATYTPAQIRELRRAAELLENHWREIDDVVCGLSNLWKLRIA